MFYRVSQCFSLVSSWVVGKKNLQEDRPTAVEVLEQMTTAMKVKTSDGSVPVYWRNGGAVTALTCEVSPEETAEWQTGRTTFRQLQAALMETVHEKCGLGSCSMA